MAMLTTPERYHITPESAPKISTITTSELPTKMEVKLTKETWDGPGERAAQNKSASIMSTATPPNRAIAPRRG